MTTVQKNPSLNVPPFLTLPLTLHQKCARWFPLSTHLHDFSWRCTDRWTRKTKDRCPHITTKKHELCALLAHTPSYIQV